MASNGGNAKGSKSDGLPAYSSAQIMDQKMTKKVVENGVSPKEIPSHDDKESKKNGQISESGETASQRSRSRRRSKTPTITSKIDRQMERCTQCQQPKRDLKYVIPTMDGDKLFCSLPCLDDHKRYFKKPAPACSAEPDKCGDHTVDSKDAETDNTQASPPKKDKPVEDQQKFLKNRGSTRESGRRSLAVGKQNSPSRADLKERCEKAKSSDESGEVPEAASERKEIQDGANIRGGC